MHAAWIPTVCASVCLALTAAPTPNAAPLENFLLDYAPTRADVLTRPTPAETEGLLGHMRAMADLTARGVVTWGGKSGEDHAIVLVRAKDRADAERIAASDPAVAKGVFTAKVTEFDLKISARFGDLAVDEPGERVLRFEAELPVELDAAWKAWTDGAAFERATGWKAILEPRMGGRFEVSFDESKPHGSRGSEGCRVLAVVPRSVLAFEWNAPPTFGELRSKRTNVVVRFAADGARTHVILEHSGFGANDEWAAVADYFEKAWPTVLAEMKTRLGAPVR
jgi:uncharacterized protein YndB with AHSA1/START domain/uncharacterized protein YciI